MDRATGRVVSKFISGVNFADSIPFNEKEAGAIAQIGIGHLAAGNTTAFLVSTAAISKVDRTQVLEDKILSKVADMLKK